MYFHEPQSWPSPFQSSRPNEITDFNKWYKTYFNVFPPFLMCLLN